ncbi:MAG: hypothetical protein HWE07_09210 [Cytophagia bacterium]|nr:hypothetical protein [Cytophagia bacterium]
MGKQKYKLNPELEGKVRIVGNPVSNKFNHHLFGLIDFENMSLKQAEILASNDKFPYLEKVGAKASATTKNS